jgi:hypothetical protein
MKKYIVITILLIITITSYSQSKFQGFFRPIERNIFVPEFPGEKPFVEGTSHLWLFRPAVSISAMQFNFNSPMTVSTLSSFGTGISYSKIINQNNLPYNVFSANFLILYTDKLGSTEPVNLSLAGTITFLQYISVGLGYSFGNKNLFMLTGVTYNFN